MVGAYTNLTQKLIPSFITSDSVLHLYHEQFDEVLKAIDGRSSARFEQNNMDQWIEAFYV